ncbi:hypothetical protein [Bartonella sp. HY406]|uniref:hypothetical protein n=1 Tax=Bartonella sp. HY406 TaxID=2979331 RepID=UPI0021C59CEC|nr:hypothetical protein [Bartonella sp. HY406]UXN03696.1 hypothetical protein N6B01_01230 [Bartonella sp. HY406]
MLDIFEVSCDFKLDNFNNNSLNLVSNIDLEDFFKVDLAIQKLNKAFNIEFSYFEDFIMNISMIEEFIENIKNASIDKAEKSRWLTLLETATKNGNSLYFVCD